VIIAAMDGRLRLVTQSDHAHLAGAILALWHTDGLPHHAAREALLYAAREHDNGWREYDAAPRVGGDGRPSDFRSIPSQDRRTLWTRGVLRHRVSQPFATLLILEHARMLHADRRHDPAWAPLLASWDLLRTELLEENDVSRDALDAAYHWIELTDSISLALAERWTEPRSTCGVMLIPQRGSHRDSVGRLAPDRLALDTLGLDPFPLAGATTFTLACRTIEDRRYTHDSDLACALAEARWEEAHIRLAPVATAPVAIGDPLAAA
jgi:hypothetical protein